MDIDFNRFLDLYELHYGGIDKCITIRNIEKTNTNGYRLKQTYGKNAHFVDIELDEKQKKVLLYYDKKIFHEEHLSDSRYEKICNDLLNVFVYMNITIDLRRKQMSRDKKEPKKLKDVEYSFKKFKEGSNMDDEESCDCDTNTLEMLPAGLPPRNLDIPVPSPEDSFDNVEKIIIGLTDEINKLRSANPNMSDDDKELFDQSKKYDKGKRRFDLVDLSTVGAIADVLGFGAQKYGENTWQDLPDGEKRYFAALLRHLESHQKGELIDAESGLPHIYHVLTNAFFLTYLFNKKEIK